MRVFVVEDEVIVAMTLDDMLTELGCSVVGPATSLDEALALAATANFDAALLDVNLGNGERSEPIVEVLRQRRIPFGFITGYGCADTDESGNAPPVLTKPCTTISLAMLLRELAEAAPPGY